MQLLSLKEVLSEKKGFVIPSYQRGFRWTSHEIGLLLDDLQEFFKDEKEPDSFYLLHLIRVKRRDDGRYEVVDGQQRLTTLYLILKNLGMKNEELYTIQYETREGSKDFLENVEKKGEEEKLKNPDFFRMFEAWKKIKEWFRSNRNNKVSLENVLEKVKFIWQEIDKEDNGEEVFLRANMGKIPLSSAELIRSFIISMVEKEDEFKFSVEWNNIQNRLLDDNFWNTFFFEKKEPHKRMEKIFDLFMNTKQVEEDERKKHLPNYLFFRFYEYIQYILREWNNKYGKQGIILSIQYITILMWMEIKDIFYKLSVWYEDDRLYHLIGFILWKKLLSLENILKISKPSEINKSASSKKELFDLLVKEAKIREEASSIKFALSLYEVAKHYQMGLRAPFERIRKEEEYQIEHIHARRSEYVIKYEDEENIKKMKEKISEYFKGRLDAIKPLYKGDISEIKRIEREIEAIKEDNNIEILKEKYKNIEEAISKIEEPLGIHLVDIDTEELDETIKIDLQSTNIETTYNFTLLPRRLNIKLKNYVFPVKRRMVLEELEKKNIYVPLIAKIAFTKEVNKDAEHLYAWLSKDGEVYEKDRKNTINMFLGGKNG
jgi:uncharacterized protein with ParB-like and HNH nuclease domain